MNQEINLEHVDRFTWERTEKPSPEDERLLFEGINVEAVKAKGVNPIRQFAVFVRDEKGKTGAD